MTGTCENPDCEATLDPTRVRHGARTCNDRCRAKAWKSRTNYGQHRQARANGPRKPSGLQVSFYKAVDVLAANLVFWLPADSSPDAEAEKILRAALSDRQRARLQERQD